MRRNLVDRTRGRRPCRHTGEVLSHQRFCRRHLDVADDDHRHAVGPVVGLIEIAQPLRRKALEDLRRADGQTVDVPRRAEERLELRLLHPRAGAQTAAPLFDHHAALAIDFDRVEGEAAGKVAQRLETALEHTGLFRRHVEHVDRLVEARVGVDVRAELRADRFQIRHQLARLEVRRAVERHVLEHVRQTALIICLVYRARFHGQTQHDAIVRQRVVTDEEGQAVRQRAGPDRQVERERSVEVLCEARRAASQEQCR